MANIKIFENPDFGTVRIQMNASGEPLFCASDVCNSLGYTNGRDAVTKHVDEDDVAKCDTIDRLGRNQQVTYITESGLYSLVFGSKVPSAKKFKKWITSEVLPSIRKTGSYSVVSSTHALPQDYLTALKALVASEEEKQMLALENKKQQQEIEMQRPAVAFTNAVQAAQSSCLVGELAKILSQNGIAIGEKRLFKWLRDHKYLGSHGERYNIPNQEYIERGIFELKKGVRSGSNGVMHTTVTPKVTGKGQVYFVNKFLNSMGGMANA